MAVSTALRWLLAAHLLPAPALLAQTRQETILSPDKRLALTLFFTGDQLQYKVVFRGKPVIEPSALGLQLGTQAVGRGQAFGRVQRTSFSATYAWRGVHSQAINAYNQASLSVAPAAPAAAFRLEARVFNNGVAWRYVVPEAGAGPVRADNTEFAIPAGSTVWSQPDIGSYEGRYQRQPIEAVPVGQLAGPPLTVALPAQQGYLAITEGGVTDFAGMSLVATGPRVFKANLTGTVATGATIETPWRVVEVGADLNTLVNCDIVHNVSPAPDASLFPQGLATPWLQPGRSVWSWLAGNGGVTFENMKRFSQWAGQLGFEYNLVDEGWTHWNDGGKDPWALMQELVAYSATQKVKVWVWKAYPDHDGTPGLQQAAARQAFFRHCRDIGVAGIKIDFFNTESQEVIRFYQAALHDAAELHLLLDFHGANKPTGESRTWPNELSREGVRGLENETVWPAHNTTLPFTRYLAGHGDYTPLTFRPIGQGTTLAHQVATLATFTSPFLCVAANPEELLTSPARELITSIPTVWDETIVLPQSEIGALSLLARRRGTTWYLTALNGAASRQLPVSLAFLGKGPYQALTLADSPDLPAKGTIKRTTVTSQTSLTLALQAGGGYLGIFRK
ncbi:MAG: glycoside hydrolase family 97 catalytic domain-containing protein [Janthinobacterium lividum]